MVLILATTWVLVSCGITCQRVLILWNISHRSTAVIVFRVQLCTANHRLAHDTLPYAFFEAVKSVQNSLHHLENMHSTGSTLIHMHTTYKLPQTYRAKPVAQKSKPTLPRRQINYNSLFSIALNSCDQDLSKGFEVACHF